MPAAIQQFALISCSGRFKRTLTLVDALYGDYHHPTEGTFRFLPHSHQARRQFPNSFNVATLYRWGQFVAMDKHPLKRLIQLLHPVRLEVVDLTVEEEEYWDMEEVEDTVVTIDRSSPTDMDEGEGVVADVYTLTWGTPIDRW
ncbi:hypothetical protein CTheo_9129 [Ceratobasidium theobromae]|uniref:Uncharacterized protein n=1 Tax=Ceratobasidium theobromae TaxID=1582974 RepID=A0A5N5Q7H8_9AGAM|nr:hypothetical protein CTheo_9129 [Ceratobasidium theobromae]